MNYEALATGKASDQEQPSPGQRVFCIPVWLQTQVSHRTSGKRCSRYQRRKNSDVTQTPLQGRSEAQLRSQPQAHSSTSACHLITDLEFWKHPPVIPKISEPWMTFSTLQEKEATTGPPGIGVAFKMPAGWSLLTNFHLINSPAHLPVVAKCRDKL